MEEERFVHMCHEHPLSLIPESAKRGYRAFCSGCLRYFIPEDVAYGCSLKCGFDWLLHKECMEMPREIMHHIHPSHPLTLHLSENIFGSRKCAFCEARVWGLHYRCSYGGCDGFAVHLRCVGGLKDNDETEMLMYHPSHPQHQLRSLKKTRWCPFPCDACGATEKGESYICTQCDYWIHESCALLPASKDFPIHHHHSLSLAFYPPPEYIQYYFYCAICNTTLQLRRWIYHCHLCSYVVHINCATSSSSMFGDENENAIEDKKEVTKFPIAVDDMFEEMIRPLVKRESGHLSVPYGDHDNQNIGGKYRFFGHPHHLLSFTPTFSSASSSSPSSSSHRYCKIDDEEEEDDDVESIPRLELICDGCTLPIRAKKQTNDDDYENENGYMSCDECKYFLHLSCFNLPLEIPSLPIHPYKDHSLMLRNADGKVKGWIFCEICYSYTNGLYYACTNKNCVFDIDIKCASLPNTIKHAAHPRHNYLKLVGVGDDIKSGGFCDNCFTSSTPVLYKCNSCRFSVCGICVMLPATNKHRLEKHLMWLTYDAYVNRPGDFYCSSCESHMDRRSWMYYCRECDQSFHPYCFPATSGEFRNIKYGTEQYVISRIHDHPLRFQIISKKKRCDLCHDDSYDEPGFQCASCFFVVCKSCGIKHMDDAQKAI